MALGRHSWLLLAAASVPCSFAACGPDAKPQEPCDGATFNLVLRAEDGPLPSDTRINVRYGSNQDGEPYTLGQGGSSSQAVFCDEDTSSGGDGSADPTAGQSSGGAAAAGAGGAASEGAASMVETSPTKAVQALRCRLYTQGPARLDATATGYEAIDDQPLSLERKKRCDVQVDVTLVREKTDAGG